MIRYFRTSIDEYSTYTAAKDLMPKECKSMAAKHNWLTKNIERLNRLNKQCLNGDKIVIRIESTLSPRRLYAIKLYAQDSANPLLLQILESWTNYDAL